MNALGGTPAATHLKGNNCHLVDGIKSFNIVRRSQDSDSEPTNRD